MPIVKFKTQSLPDGFSTLKNFYRIDSQEENISLINMTCPHRGGPLTHAESDGEYLICPWHKRKCKKINLKNNLQPAITIDENVYFMIDSVIKNVFKKLLVSE